MKGPPCRRDGGLDDQVERSERRSRDDDKEEPVRHAHALSVSTAAPPAVVSPPYLMSVSILNIGIYIAMTIVPTMMPTKIMRTGSMMDVSDWMLESTSSS